MTLTYDVEYLEAISFDSFLFLCLFQANVMDFYCSQRWLFVSCY